MDRGVTAMSRFLEIVVSKPDKHASKRPCLRTLMEIIKLYAIWWKLLEHFQPYWPYWQIKIIRSCHCMFTNSAKPVGHSHMELQSIAEPIVAGYRSVSKQNLTWQRLVFFLRVSFCF
jgi:hypothetical protein